MFLSTFFTNYLLILIFQTFKLLNFKFQSFKLSNLSKYSLTLSWRRPLSYRYQSIDLLRKSMNWFLYDNGLRHERVKEVLYNKSLSMKFLDLKGLKTVDHRVIFSVLEVKRSKYKKNVFANILGFIFYGVSRAKAYLLNKYMI